MTAYYEDPKFPAYLVRSATLEDDPQLVALIGESMPSNGMILSFQRKPSYWAATQAQYEYPDLQVVVPRENTKLIVGMMNLGWRPCFINGESENVRYVGDLRLSREHRGGEIMALLMSYVYNKITRQEIYQAVVLDDNTVARHILHQERKYFPKPFIYDKICTYTVTAFKNKYIGTQQYQVEPMTATDIDDLAAFWKKMAAYYNFLPHYDFNQLIQGHPYWKGLTLQDFFCIKDANGVLVGMFGLWDQKSFKQTTVKSYSKTLKFIRPFYNFYANLVRDLTLPKVNQSFDYLMLHSALCAPDALDVFAIILENALALTRQRGKQAFCTTLSLKDPKTECMQHARYHKMTATISFHSFERDPFEYFDQTRLNYVEVGRI